MTESGAGSGPGSGEDRAVELAAFQYRHEAELALGFLEEAGVRAVVVGDAAGEIQFGKGFSSRSRLLVRARDREQGEEVLRQAGIQGSEDS